MGARAADETGTRTTLCPARFARGSHVLSLSAQPTHFTKKRPPFASTIFSGTYSFFFFATIC